MASVTGHQQIIRKLKSLPPKLARNIQNKAGRAAGRVFVKGARQRIPGNLDTLKRAMSVRKRRNRGPTFFHFTVTPTKGKHVKYDAWYAHFFEFGVPKQTITVKNKQVLAGFETVGRSGGGQYMFFGKVIETKGIDALNFMSGTFLADNQKALEEFRKKLADEVSKI